MAAGVLVDSNVLPDILEDPAPATDSALIGLGQTQPLPGRRPFLPLLH